MQAQSRRSEAMGLFNQDYIMRMIEQLVAGIARIMRLKEEDRLEECEDLLSDTLRTFYGLNERSVDMMPHDDLVAIASLGGLPDAERCALLAQLIMEKADLAARKGDGGQAAALRVKALAVYLTALLADADYHTAEHRGRVDGLIDLAAGYALPPDTWWKLFRYHEGAGRFAKAEDALWRLLDDTGTRAAAAEEGRAFYQRLLVKGDAELTRGNLPRAEVEDGLARLATVR